MTLASSNKVSEVLLEILDLRIRLVADVESVLEGGAVSALLPSGRTAGLTVVTIRSTY